MDSVDITMTRPCKLRFSRADWYSASVIQGGRPDRRLASRSRIRITRSSRLVASAFRKLLGGPSAGLASGGGPSPGGGSGRSGRTDSRALLVKSRRGGGG